MSIKNLFICAFLSILMACQLTIEEPIKVEPIDPPVYYEVEYEYDYGYCAYDPWPYDTMYITVCSSYTDSEYCMWTLHYSYEWACDHTWCFYWDTCEWEHHQSDCW